ncbi:MAG: hypothetical protein LBQ89_08640 [Treponema sp.]|jgi:hypothetical protein|nr:hypothetical protein [Treponema sp.]
MNTIPLTFNERITPYTAVGGKERIASTGISAVILNRSGHPHRSFLQDIEKTGFDNVISVESASPHYDIEELAGRFPFVRFILPEHEINMGEQINLAACEIESPLFLVLHSDTKIIAGGTARRMAERISLNQEEGDENSGKTNGFKRLCTVPVIVNSNYEVLPTLSAPMTHKRKMRTVFFEPQTDGDLSLYPFDGIGIYDRQRFIQIGGYDITLKNLHWQLMDFGFRACLWGEEIALNLHIKLSYDSQIPSENYTVEESYRRFYLKNLAPVFRRDYAHLPLYRFPAFLRKSGEDVFLAWEEFSQTRKWVAGNKFRWRCDARGVTVRWNNLNAPAGGE